MCNNKYIASEFIVFSIYYITFATMSDLKVFIHISEPAQISVTDIEIRMKR